MTTAIIILLIINILIGLTAIILSLRVGKAGGITKRETENIVKDESDFQTRTLQSTINTANSTLLSALKVHTETQGASSDRFMSVVAGNIDRQDKRQQEFMQSVENRLEGMKSGLEKTLSEVRKENNEQLEKMRVVVEEKMQKTLNERLNQSFGMISEQLDKVKEGLGEMKSLTEGVTDLKKVLGGVKTRGVWGEVSLGTLIDEILIPEQYRKNEKIGRKGEIVEFAVMMPGKGEEKVKLPIDAKFPLEDYQRLVEASEQGDKVLMDGMGAALERRIKEEAKTIADKYIKPPETTDFAVMYLPIEGLFAEIARRPGLMEGIHAKYRVLVTGPTTLSALLNSLQVGFKTVAIEERSREIWKLLSAFRTEFVRFAELLDKTQGYAEKVSDGIRDAAKKSFTIQKKLSNVELIGEPEGDAE